MDHYGPVPRYVLEDPSIQQGRFHVGNALESLRRMVLQADIDQVRVAHDCVGLLLLMLLASC